MANEVLFKERASQFSFADHANDFSPAAGTSLEQGTPTNVDMAMASVSSNAGRNSDKFDFGATFAMLFAIISALEFAATPTDGNPVNYFLAPSNDSVAANGNPGGADGVDGAYAGGGDLASGLKQLMHIGSFINTSQATATVQVAFVGVFQPPMRHGQLILENQSGAAMHSDDVEIHTVFDPIITEIQ